MIKIIPVWDVINFRKRTTISKGIKDTTETDKKVVLDTRGRADEIYLAPNKMKGIANQ